MPNVYCNDVCEWWIGESVDDVIADYEKTTGLEFDPADYGKWIQVPDDEVIRVWSEEPWGEGTPQACTIEQDGLFYICSAKARDWANTGNGFLCSTEY